MCPDLNLARMCLVHMFDQDEKIVADNGYNDLEVFVNDEQGVVDPRNTTIRKILARHEPVNTRVRVFEVLQDKHKGNIEFYPSNFHACVNIVQLEIENGAPLSDMQWTYPLVKNLFN